MADGGLPAALAVIRDRNEDRITARAYTAHTVEHDVAEGDVRRLLAGLIAAAGFHERIPLYGRAATEEDPGRCPHDPDSGMHFEDSDNPGTWLCEGLPDGAVCSTCVDGEGGERVEWPCPEYEAILAALGGKETDGG